ncbi:hypothetical protein [Coleofasciculus sp. FACHB-SPT9]|uniref:hypothetical protein n=1 Tax=Cyanophyceae TaxID=3028117 RepID=UPI0016865FB4|nr:hypothetical protein [Coleofasciculus sp. FACHB-SPT9]MBD1890494.1 hypothetical protein [Coleofasciculus sp. FACHB-SPT9]
MIVTLSIDTSLMFENGTLRETMEQFLTRKITHRQAAVALKRTPQEVSLTLGALFVLAARPQNNRGIEMKCFPELTMRNPYGLAKALFLGGNLPEDMVDNLLGVLSEGGFFDLQRRLKEAGDELRSQEN